jgi:hypothetical protein
VEASIKISLAEASRLLGQSARQVRYRIKVGELMATKEGGRWMVDDGELRLSPGRKAAAERKAEDLRQSVEAALGPRARRGRPYSVRDVHAFARAVAAFRAATQALGDAHPTTAALSGSVVLITQGCHRFAGRDKAAAFRDARERAAEAVALLHLEGSEAATRIADDVEQEYLPVLAGLVRRYERRGQP